MIGKIFGIGGKSQSVTIKFNITPENAVLTLKDRDKKELPHAEDNIYKIAPGLYYYDVTAEDYISILDEKLIVLEDETIDINLKYIAYRSKKKYSYIRYEMGKNRSKCRKSSKRSSRKRNNRYNC